MPGEKSLWCTVVITVFRPWYLAHTALADNIFFVPAGPWAVSLIRGVRERVV